MDRDKEEAHKLAIATLSCQKIVAGAYLQAICIGHNYLFITRPRKNIEMDCEFASHEKKNKYIHRGVNEMEKNSINQSYFTILCEP
jgi:hypothetical protein